MWRKGKEVKYLLLGLLIVLFFLVGCITTLPTNYNQIVEIKSGPYKGKLGRLIGDCPGFETYKVRMYNNVKLCFKVWELEKFE